MMMTKNKGGDYDKTMMIVIMDDDDDDCDRG